VLFKPNFRFCKERFPFPHSLRRRKLLDALLRYHVVFDGKASLPITEVHPEATRAFVLRREEIKGKSYPTLS